MSLPARRWPWIIGLAAFALHGLIAWLFPLPGAFRKYGLAAEQYLSGELPSERLMDFSAFYFHLSVWAERWLPAPEASITWLQIALATGSVALVFELFKPRMGVAWATAAALILALDRHLLVYARILEPEVCLLFCLLIFLWLLDRPAPAAPWFAGVSAALCLAIRPTFLPAFLLVPFYFWLRSQPPQAPAEPIPDRRWFRKSLAFLAPVTCMILLLALRAGAITGDPRTPMMNPGTVFFEGNNPLSQGTSAIYPPVVLAYVRHTGDEPDPAHQHYRRVARAAAEGDPELTIAEVNAYWSGLALRFIREEPSRWLGLLGVKLKRAFHGFRWHDVPTAWKLDQRLFFVPTIPFALISALAFVGALFEAKRWRESLIYFALAAIQLAVMLVFYVSARQRLVLLPALLYFAAVAARRLVRERAWPWALLVALLALTFSLPDDAMEDEAYRRRGWQETEYRLDLVREQSRKQPLALHAELAVEAVASAPWWLDWLRPAFFPRNEGSLEERVAQRLASQRQAGNSLASASADFDLASIQLAAGQLAEAQQWLKQLSEQERFVYRGGRQPSEPLTLLGRATALAGERDRAIEVLEAALERSTGDPFTLAELVALGESEYQTSLQQFWGPIDSQYLLGRALLIHGQYHRAAQALGFVVHRLGDFRDARVLLAAALGANSQIEDGARQYLEATRLRPEPILAEREISELFRRWAAAHPESLEVQLYATQVLHRHGHFSEALAMLEALDPPPDLVEPIARERSRILQALGDRSHLDEGKSAL